MYKSFSDSKVKSFAKFSPGTQKSCVLSKQVKTTHGICNVPPTPKYKLVEAPFSLLFGFAHKCVRGPVFTENGCISLFLTQKLKVLKNFHQGPKILRFVKNRSKRHMEFAMFLPPSTFIPPGSKKRCTSLFLCDQVFLKIFSKVVKT